MKEWRFIDSGADNPYRNMALDESLLAEYRRTKQPVFRLYSWKPYGFSLGYSQDTDKVLFREKCQRENVFYVRRITGGTIIYHGPEITYSLACSESDIDKPKNVKESFKILCSFLFDFYKGLGKEPYFAIDRKKPKTSVSTFCFGSRQDYDILIDDKKIGGNAQRRLKEVIFQHGSIPLSIDTVFIQSFLKEKIAGISKDMTCLKEIIGQDIDTQDIIFRLKESLKKVFSCKIKETGFSSKELAQARMLEDKKYRSQDWNLNRQIVNLNG